MRAQQPRAEAVEGAHERGLGVARGLALAELQQARAHALAQLARGALGERDREDPRRRDPVLAHRPDEALDEHRGLAAARAPRTAAAARRARATACSCSSVSCRSSRSSAHRSHRQIVGIHAAAADSAGLRARLAARPRPPRAAAARAASSASASSSRTSSCSRPSPRTQSSSTPRVARRARRARAGPRRTAAGRSRRPPRTSEQLLDGAHVQRDLQRCPSRDPPRRRPARCGPCSRRRPPRPLGLDVDAVDAPAQRHAAAELERGQLAALAALASAPVAAKPNPSSSWRGSSGLAALGRVLADSARGPRCSRRARPAARSGAADSGNARPRSSLERRAAAARGARPGCAGVSARRPRLAPQPLERVPQHRVRERRRGRAARGRGRARPGRSSRSTNQRTGQPIQRSSEDADHSCARSAASSRCVAQRRRLGRRAARGANAAPGAVDGAERAAPASLARGPRRTGRRRRPRTASARVGSPSSSATCQLSTSSSSGRETAA